MKKRGSRLKKEIKLGSFINIFYILFVILILLILSSVIHFIVNNNENILRIDPIIINQDPDYAMLPPTPTYTPTSTLTYTPTYTPFYAPTYTPTETPTDTPTETFTETPIYTPLDTPTEYPTDTPTGTFTETPTLTLIPTSTLFSELYDDQYCQSLPADFCEKCLVFDDPYDDPDCFSCCKILNPDITQTSETSCDASCTCPEASPTETYVCPESCTQEPNFLSSFVFFNTIISSIREIFGFTDSDIPEECPSWCYNIQSSATETLSPIDTITQTPVETSTIIPTDSPIYFPTETRTETPSEYPTYSPTYYYPYPTDYPAYYPTETPIYTPTETITETPTEYSTDTPTETVTEYPTPESSPFLSSLVFIDSVWNFITGKVFFQTGAIQPIPTPTSSCCCNSEKPKECSYERNCGDGIHDKSKQCDTSDNNYYCYIEPVEDIKSLSTELKLPGFVNYPKPIKCDGPNDKIKCALYPNAKCVKMSEKCSAECCLNTEFSKIIATRCYLRYNIQALFQYYNFKFENNVCTPVRIIKGSTFYEQETYRNYQTITNNDNACAICNDKKIIEDKLNANNVLDQLPDGSECYLSQDVLMKGVCKNNKCEISCEGDSDCINMKGSSPAASYVTNKLICDSEKKICVECNSKLDTEDPTCTYSWMRPELNINKLRLSKLIDPYFYNTRFQYDLIFSRNLKGNYCSNQKCFCKSDEECKSNYEYIKNKFPNLNDFPGPLGKYCHPLLQICTECRDNPDCPVDYPSCINGKCSREKCSNDDDCKNSPNVFCKEVIPGDPTDKACKPCDNDDDCFNRYGNDFPFCKKGQCVLIPEEVEECLLGGPGGRFDIQVFLDISKEQKELQENIKPFFNAISTTNGKLTDDQVNVVSKQVDILRSENLKYDITTKYGTVVDLSDTITSDSLGGKIKTDLYENVLVTTGGYQGMGGVTESKKEYYFANSWKAIGFQDWIYLFFKGELQIPDSLVPNKMYNPEINWYYYKRIPRTLYEDLKGEELPDKQGLWDHRPIKDKAGYYLKDIVDLKNVQALETGANIVDLTAGFIIPGYFGSSILYEGIREHSTERIIAGSLFIASSTLPWVKMVNSCQGIPKVVQPLLNARTGAYTSMIVHGMGAGAHAALVVDDIVNNRIGLSTMMNGVFFFVNGKLFLKQKIPLRVTIETDSAVLTKDQLVKKIVQVADLSPQQLRALGEDLSGIRAEVILREFGLDPSKLNPTQLSQYGELREKLSDILMYAGAPHVYRAQDEIAKALQDSNILKILNDMNAGDLSQRENLATRIFDGYFKNPYKLKKEELVEVFNRKVTDIPINCFSGTGLGTCTTGSCPTVADDVLNNWWQKVDLSKVVADPYEADILFRLEQLYDNLYPGVINELQSLQNFERYNDLRRKLFAVYLFGNIDRTTGRVRECDVINMLTLLKKYFGNDAPQTWLPAGYQRKDSRQFIKSALNQVLIPKVEGVYDHHQYILQLSRILITNDPGFSNPMGDLFARMMAEEIDRFSYKDYKTVADVKEALVAILMKRMEMANLMNQPVSAEKIQAAINRIQGLNYNRIHDLLFFEVGEGCGKYDQLYSLLNDLFNKGRRQNLVKPLIENRNDPQYASYYQIMRMALLQRSTVNLPPFELPPGYRIIPIESFTNEIKLPFSSNTVKYTIYRFRGEKIVGGTTVSKNYFVLQYLEPEVRSKIHETVINLFLKALQAPTKGEQAKLIAEMEYFYFITDLPNKGGAFTGDAFSLLLQKKLGFPLRTEYKHLDYYALSALSKEEYIAQRSQELLNQ